LEKVCLAERISVITNGVDLEQFQPQAPAADFLGRWNLTGRFVCAYVGTIGMAHGLDVVLRAAGRLKERGRRDICFCLVGDGAEREKLQRQSHEMKVTDWVRFTGRLPRSEMNAVLASSDCLLVHLKKRELFETVIPSKIFESMAMERPLIMGVRGEAAKIVRCSGAGMEIEPDNDAQLADAVCRLKDDLAFYQSLCHRGRSFVSMHYTRDVLATQYLQIISQVAHREEACPRKASHDLL
jgi:glycosyltransferase involved in cell wall biosynthesis